MPTPAEVDAALAQWRERLAAASRNISELSELPSYAAARRLTDGTGRLADEARQLAATMDELWHGLLLIGATLDQAEQARRSAAWPRRPDQALARAMAILTGESITVDLADTPVLHRRLLAGPRATAVVSPQTLLQTMEAAFDSARERLIRITDTTGMIGRRRTELDGMLAHLPPLFRDRLAAAEQADPLDTLDALTGLVPVFSEAVRMDDALRVAERSLTDVRGTAAWAELADWLARLRATFTAGRVEGCRVGLCNWRVLRDCWADLAARYRARRAQQQATRPDVPALGALAEAAKAALTSLPIDTERAKRALAAYERALAGKIDG